MKYLITINSVISCTLGKVSDLVLLINSLKNP